MLVAALDTSTLTLSCALVELAPGRAELVAERLEHAPAKPPPGTARDGPRGGHGAWLPSALTDLLAAHGKRLPDVEGYAIGIGPGSFTGLRIGLATWKGLAYANRRPIAGASSLAALALAAAEGDGVDERTVLVPLLDAKKGEVYAGFYRVAGRQPTPVVPEEALTPQRLVERVASLDARAVALGEGYRAYADVLAPHLPQLERSPESPGALAVARLCAGRLLGAGFDAQALFALEPHYVRLSEAELKFPKGLAPGAAG